MFKRGPIIVIGIVAVALLAAPFALGMLAESNVRAQVEELNNYPPLSFEIKDYERGWLGSRAIIEVRPNQTFMSTFAADVDATGLVDEAIAPFVLELGHGPILTLNGFGFGSYAVKASLDSESDLVQMITGLLGVPYLIELRGRAGIGSGFEFEGEIPPFDSANGDETFSFSGLEFTGRTNGTDVTFDAGLDSFVLQGPAESVSFEGFAFGGDYMLRPGTMALGTGEMSLDRLAITNPLLGVDAASGFSGIRVSATSALNNAGNVDLRVGYAVDSMMIPEIEGISDLELGFALVNIDAQAVDDLYAMLDRMYSGASSPDTMMFEMLPIASRIVAAGPAVAIDPLRLSMDGRSLHSSLTVSLDPTALPTGQIMDLMNTQVLMNAIDAKLELTSSKELLSDLMTLGLTEQMGPQLAGRSEDEISALMNQQAEQSLSMAVAQGMLSDDGDTYSTTITFADGVANVNGVPLPLGAMGLF